MNEVKRLYRSRNNRMVSGLCGGIADYLGIDATIVRVVMVIATVVLAGLPAAVYLLLILVVPEEPLSGPRPGGDVGP
jgi:phage shock protein PspC (stress-responsive transcriptional regulator)